MSCRARNLAADDVEILTLVVMLYASRLAPRRRVILAKRATVNH
jgi:hypothetical protein